MYVSAQHQDIAEVVLRPVKGKESVYRINTGDSPLCVTVDTESPTPPVKEEVSRRDAVASLDSEIPSQLFDGVVFLPFRGTVRHEDRIAENCPHYELLWFLECCHRENEIAYLENAAMECWGKKLDSTSTSNKKDRTKEISDITVSGAFREAGNMLNDIGFTTSISVNDGVITVK